MSEFASQGHVVRLNDLLKQSRKISAADFDLAALNRYAEYPQSSGNIYALPINQDCMVWCIAAICSTIRKKRPRSKANTATTSRRRQPTISCETLRNS